MIAILDYGGGNVKSLQFALQRLGSESVLTNDSKIIQKSDKVIFPGQGAAGIAMKKLRQNGLDKLIPKLKQPVLGICLGMQLFCDSTEEDQVKGLGIISGKVIRFSKKVKVPQMGWNSILDLETPLFNNIKEGEFMYLVHSYYVPLLPETIAQSKYDGLYSVAIRKNNFYGVQFHPEKSSNSGSQLLKNFLAL